METELDVFHKIAVANIEDTDTMVLFKEICNKIPESSCEIVFYMQLTRHSRFSVFRVILPVFGEKMPFGGEKCQFLMIF